MVKCGIGDQLLEVEAKGMLVVKGTDAVDG